jgi:hypothetical protein
MFKFKSKITLDNVIDEISKLPSEEKTALISVFNEDVIEKKDEEVKKLNSDMEKITKDFKIISDLNTELKIKISEAEIKEKSVFEEFKKQSLSKPIIASKEQVQKVSNVIENLKI